MNLETNNASNLTSERRSIVVLSRDNFLTWKIKLTGFLLEHSLHDFLKNSSTSSFNSLTKTIKTQGGSKGGDVGMAVKVNGWHHWKEKQKLGGGAHQGQSGWSKTTGAMDLIIDEETQRISREKLPAPTKDPPARGTGHQNNQTEDQYYNHKKDEEGGRFFGDGLTTKQKQIIDILNTKTQEDDQSNDSKFESSAGIIEVLIVTQDRARCYPELFRLGTLNILVGLRSHENVEIAIIQEFIDDDTKLEEEQDSFQVEAALFEEGWGWSELFKAIDGADDVFYITHKRLNTGQSEDWNSTVNAPNGYISFLELMEGMGQRYITCWAAAEDRARLCEFFDGLLKPGGQE
ncbi:hypothetical protein BY996DRAFT_6461532 [Phakopsora pachyrhizi]|nr:hypothetical protein BY996DRAFT_6461532 [Phakopsora pachyrhizi]